MEQVLVLNLAKRLLSNNEWYTMGTIAVGETVVGLINFITNYYKMKSDDLVKNEDDDFPYFTDGGFKYTVTTPDWEYVFTCHPFKLLR